LALRPERTEADRAALEGPPEFLFDRLRSQPTPDTPYTSPQRLENDKPRSSAWDGGVFKE